MAKKKQPTPLTFSQEQLESIKKEYEQEIIKLTLIQEEQTNTINNLSSQIKLLIKIIKK
tara:strand:- start:82 stop:258 length:177 start_codon:yes stop_codon:yes gene_type:complete